MDPGFISGLILPKFPSSTDIQIYTPPPVIIIIIIIIIIPILHIPDEACPLL